MRNKPCQRHIGYSIYRLFENSVKSFAKIRAYTAADGNAGAPGPAPTPGQPLPFVRPSTPLKDRFNYLTSDVGAQVLATSEGTKGAGNILDGDRDRYMMAKRDVKKKWVTLALIEDILLDTVVLANFEYYSSSARRWV